MIGVKELINKYKPKIDWEKKAKEKAKELGVSKDDILKEWEDARNKGITKGKALHEVKRSEMQNCDNYVCYEYSPAGDDFTHIPENYVVGEGFTYDEKPFVHPKVPLIGIPDRVYIKDGKVYIDDFKSDKAIYKIAKTFKNGRFITKQKMTGPISHLDYCNYIEYNLQLSLYMRLILDNNKTLRAGKLRILHTLYDEDTLQPIKEEIMEVPYLRREVSDLLKTLKI